MKKKGNALKPISSTVNFQKNFISKIDQKYSSHVQSPFKVILDPIGFDGE